MDARLLILVLSVATATSGCASFKKHHMCCSAPVAPAIVTTGGQYSLSRSISIPQQGLTLGQVVEMSLRPGLDNDSVAGSNLNTNLGPSGGQSAIDSGRRAVTWASQFGNTADPQNQIGSHVDEIIQELQGGSGKVDPTALALIKPAIAQSFQNAATLLVKQQTDVQRQTTLNNLADGLETSITFGSMRTGSVPTDAQITAAATAVTWLLSQEAPVSAQTAIITFLRNIKPADLPIATIDASSLRIAAGKGRALVDSIRGLSAGNGPISVPQPTNTVQAAPSLLDGLAVILTRASGRSIITPLWMARTYSAADIWLVHGDHVQIAPFQLTNITAPSSGGNIAVTGVTIQAHVRSVTLGSTTANVISQLTEVNDPAADVMIVRRIGMTGNLEEYLLPLNRNDIYGNNPTIAQFLKQAQITGGDQIHMEVLDLTPIISDSRQKIRLASIDLGSQCQQKLTFFQNRWNKLGTQSQTYTGVNPKDVTNASDQCHRNMATYLPATLK